ncbi:hypothetical protein BDBG_17576, partial [Blastomyces gilchristii SLH14081]
DDLLKFSSLSNSEWPYCQLSRWSSGRFTRIIRISKNDLCFPRRWVAVQPSPARSSLVLTAWKRNGQTESLTPPKNRHPGCKVLIEAISSLIGRVTKSGSCATIAIWRSS